MTKKKEKQQRLPEMIDEIYDILRKIIAEKRDVVQGDAESLVSKARKIERDIKFERDPREDRMKRMIDEYDNKYPRGDIESSDRFSIKITDKSDIDFLLSPIVRDYHRLLKERLGIPLNKENVDMEFI